MQEKKAPQGTARWTKDLILYVLIFLLFPDISSNGITIAVLGANRTGQVRRFGSNRPSRLFWRTGRNSQRPNRTEPVRRSGNVREAFGGLSGDVRKTYSEPNRSQKKRTEPDRLWKMSSKFKFEFKFELAEIKIGLSFERQLPLSTTSYSRIVQLARLPCGRLV